MIYKYWIIAQTVDGLFSDMFFCPIRNLIRIVLKQTKPELCMYQHRVIIALWRNLDNVGEQTVRDYYFLY